ncbi:MAG TPA: polyprenyl synthetase family protein [Candidatus Dormibacteraeota bacterium]|nr:polyprenyl synthetase family protein [Candidatus Dormibacteraeota bacterium]
MISDQAELAESEGSGTLALGAQEILGRYQEKIQQGLGEVMDHLPTEVVEPARYHLGLLPGARPGKALRPTLTLLLADALGAPSEAALPLALAVQLVHDFSLLHDDIVDGDRSRRGQPALWVKDGMPVALNTGDALLTAAFCVISTADLPSRTTTRGTRRLSAATMEMVGGQQADISATGAPTADLPQYLSMVERKTGALMGAAAALGGIAAGGSGATVDACESFGRTLGVAFQLRDDVLGVFGDSAETGKPVGNDLLRGKQGLPMVLALAGNGQVCHTVRSWLAPPGLRRRDLAAAVELLREGGVAERCQGLTTTWTERALVAAAKLPLSEEGAMELEILGRWLGERWS